MTSLSMVVDYLDFVGTGIGPDEADAIPVVDANAILPITVSGQSLQTVAGRYAEIVQDCGGIELVQLSTSYTPNSRGQARLARRVLRPLKTSSVPPSLNETTIETW